MFLFCVFIYGAIMVVVNNNNNNVQNASLTSLMTTARKRTCIPVPYGPVPAVAILGIFAHTTSQTSDETSSSRSNPADQFLPRDAL